MYGHSWMTHVPEEHHIDESHASPFWGWETQAPQTPLPQSVEDSLPKAKKATPAPPSLRATPPASLSTPNEALAPALAQQTTPAARPSEKATRITVRTLRKMKEQGEKIAMLTAYDATFARLLDEAGVEMLLVGDSLGMVVQGAEHTLAVSLEEMIYHTRCVARGAKRAMIVGDLPFMSYQVSPAQALESAGRMVKEGGAHAVKLEGGEEIAESIKLIVRAGIPVVGHLGLTPQSVHAMGGFVVQGRQKEQAEAIMKSALALEAAGACCLVLEGIPAPLAEAITSALKIPTIGIGAGIGCDGQVLVIYDLLGMSTEFKPRFVKQYQNLHQDISSAVRQYRQEVKEGAFPEIDHSFF